MILRKPYAFLIKYFRIIHLVLVIPTIYLIVKATSIFHFFDDYVANNYSLANPLFSVSDYIPILMYISIALILIIAILICSLFKVKDKPRKIYIAIIIFYLIYFASLVVSSNIIYDLQTTSLSASYARSYRDISLLLIIPQYIFAIVAILRGLGFNIKKLNFANDLKDLEIAEEDSEEFELALGLSGNKFKIRLRRFLREFKYYIKENTFIVIAIIILAILSILVANFSNKQKYDKTYTEGTSFIYDGFSLNAKETLITNISYNGNVISKENFYLLIKMNIKNNFNKPKKFELSNISIDINNKNVYPITNKINSFADYGIPYKGEEIKAGDSHDYLIVFPITKDTIYGSYKLRLYNGMDIKGNKNTKKYINISLNPTLIDSQSSETNFTLGQKVDFSDSNLKNSSLTINTINTGLNYPYEYQNCVMDVCRTYKNVVNIDYTKEGGALLVIDYNLELDKESSINSLFKGDGMFFNYLGSVSYNINTEEHKSKLINITPASLKNKLVLQINKDVLAGTDRKLNITIRNKTYSLVF